MLRFSFDVDGIPQFDRAFNRIQQYVSDFRNVWPGVADVFYAAERERFATEGARGVSGKWAPLSPAYKKFKAIAFPGQPILRASTSLYEAMTDPEAPDAIFRPEKDQLIMGAKTEYALAHHRGSSRRNLPARPIISLTENDKRKIQKSIQSDLVRLTRELGFQVDERAA